VSVGAVSAPVGGGRLSRVVGVYRAASGRSARTVARVPALLVSPVSMSLFFMLIYSGQLSRVGAAYLEGTTFIAFILPLILLTGAVTAAATAGELLVRDVSSGYLDRLTLAHGNVGPFVLGPLVAAAGVVGVQALLTVAGAVVLGFRAGAGAVLALVVLTVVVGVVVATIGVAVALRFGSSAAVNGVTLLFFGLSFFTGVLAPADQLPGWMRGLAAVNPVTYLLEAMRATVGADSRHVPWFAVLILVSLGVVGVVAVVAASRYRRANR
jgi:ABC-2 type transport system permease protein